MLGFITPACDVLECKDSPGCVVRAGQKVFDDMLFLEFFCFFIGEGKLLMFFGPFIQGGIVNADMARVFGDELRVVADLFVIVYGFAVAFGNGFFEDFTPGFDSEKVDDILAVGLFVLGRSTPFS